MIYVVNDMTLKRGVGSLAEVYEPSDTLELTEAEAALIGPNVTVYDQPVSAPNGDGLDDLTVAELKSKLDERGLSYAPTARKADLIAALRAAAPEGN